MAGTVRPRMSAPCSAERTTCSEGLLLALCYRDSRGDRLWWTGVFRQTLKFGHDPALLCVERIVKAILIL